jgi:hypothetical protein
MIGVIHLGGLRPTPGILNDVLEIGESVRSGRYGNFTLVVSSEDDATRSVLRDTAASKNVAIFLTKSPLRLANAEPVGDLTAKDRETITLVLHAGGTVTAAALGEQLGIEQTTAGNRLVALQKKGFLQRVERPHPEGDLFIDPRSVRFGPIAAEDAKPTASR